MQVARSSSVPEIYFNIFKNYLRQHTNRLQPNHMKILPRISTLAVAALLAASVSPSIHAQTSATTDPVGFYKITLAGASDNFISLPMARDAVFAGTVAGSITANSFTVNAGSGSPNWTASQFVYANPAQRETYYAEFTSGALRGLYYKVTANGTNSLTLDTEGDSLLTHALPGAPAAALLAGDGVKLRPYWRVKDVFEVAGAPVIEARTVTFTAKDDIFIPNYTSVGVNKSASVTIYYHAGNGWRAVGQSTTDYADFLLKPNECIIVRRRNVANLDLTNTGWVLMNKGITFIPGGNGSVGNDTYISINRPAPVKLDDSGLRIADQSKSIIVDSISTFNRQDELFAWDPGTGLNRAPTKTYFYLAGQGWRQVGNASTTIGQTVLLNPGEAYVVRKKAANAGRDWVNDANY